MRLTGPQRILIYFAHNPRDLITSREMEKKFGVTQHFLHSTMRALRRDGLITADPFPGPSRNGPGNTLIWGAGPVLLKELGLL